MLAVLRLVWRHLHHAVSCYLRAPSIEGKLTAVIQVQHKGHGLKSGQEPALITALSGFLWSHQPVFDQITARCLSTHWCTQKSN